MELVRRAQQLQARMAALSPPVRRRFVENPALSTLLGELQELVTKLAEVENLTVDEFISLEATGNDLVEEWAEQIANAECEIRIAGDKPEPVCPYCNSVFPVIDPRSEHAVWAKFRRHVEKLHPLEWQAAREA